MTAPEPITPAPLTAEQLANWRKLLAGAFGPYALVMPVEDVEAYRATTQQVVNATIARRTQEPGEPEVRT